MRDYKNVYPGNDDDIIVLRRFGPRFEKPCKRPAVVERNVSTILRQSGFAFRLESFGGWSVD